MEVLISRSPKSDKRLQAKFQNKTVHFGAAGGQTYVDHKNDNVKDAWIARHKVKGTFENLQSPSGLSKNILWNKRNMKASIQNLNSSQKQYKFKLK